MSYSYPLTEGAIVSIERLAVKQTYWDIQVADTHNYVTADGTIHHNSGKTFTCAFKALALCCRQAPDGRGVRRSTGLVTRTNMTDLEASGLKDWLGLLDGKFEGRLGKFFWGAPARHELRFALPDGTKVEADIYFMGLDDPDGVDKVRGMPLTWAWLNECKDIPFALVTMINSRTGRFPRMEDGGPTWHGTFGDTNMPHMGHWMQKWERNAPEGWEFFRQPGGVFLKDGKWELNPKAENLEHLPPSYYSDLLAGAKPEWIKVFLAAEYGFALQGTPVFPEYADGTHCREFELSKATPLRIGLDFGNCYDDKTEILTRRGWRLLKDIVPAADLVATLDPATFEMTFTRINFKTERDWDGDLLSFSGQGFDFTVTPEHRVPFTGRGSSTRLQFDSAANLAKRCRGHNFIQLAAWGWTGRRLKFFDLPPSVAASFLGWYLSEGSVEKIGNYYRVSIAQKKAAPALDSMMASPLWPGWARWKKNKGGWRGRVPPDMGAYLRLLGHAAEKLVPDAVKESRSDDLRVFLDAFIDGDGHRRASRRRMEAYSGGRRSRDGEVTAATVSPRLRDGLQEIAAKLGIATATRLQRGKGATMRDGRRIPPCDIWMVAFKQASRAEILPHHVKRVPYKGKVYCLNVPFHTLLIRRRGKVSWNGNTPAALIAQRTASGRWLWADEIVTSDYGIIRFAELLRRHLREKYEGFKIANITGDPAGAAMQSGDESERNVFDIMRAHGIEAEPAHTNDPTVRREALASYLTKMIDGQPGFLIHPRCEIARVGLAGGYKYRKPREDTSETVRLRPDKNMWSHVVEAGEYCMMGAGEDLMLIASTDPAWRKPIKYPAKMGII